VDSAVYSPDGSRILSISDAAGVQIWDAQSGIEIAALGLNTFVPGGFAAYSPDGSHVAAIVEARPFAGVKVWDARNGSEIANLKEPGVVSIAYSPDGFRIASGSSYGTVKVWDAGSGAEVATLRRDRGWVRALAYSPDGSHIATAADGKPVKVFDARTGGEILSLRADGHRVSALTYSPDGSRIATAAEGKPVKVWDSRTGAEVAILRGSERGERSVCYSPDGSRIATASGNAVKVWNAKTGAEVATLIASPRVVWVAYSPDGSRLVGSSMGEIKIWDARNNAAVASFDGAKTTVTSVVYSADGSRIVATDGNNTTLVLDAAGRLLPNEKVPEELTGSNVSPDGKFVAVTDGAAIHIWRRRPAPGEYDPWAEDWQRRRVQSPFWHAQQAEAAHERGDSFAENFHRRRITEGDNPLLLAWAWLAAGNPKECKEALLAMHRQHRALAELSDAGPLFSTQACGGPMPQPLGICAAPAARVLAQREKARRAAILVRAATLLPASGIASAELVALTGTCVADDLQSWQGRELLGAALLRDGKPTEAIKELEEAMKRNPKGGSLWTKLFLALAHQRLGHREQANEWLKKADKANSWEEQVMQFQLLGELEPAKRNRKP
jgi:WD40 repeat protein